MTRKTVLTGIIEQPDAPGGWVLADVTAQPEGGERMAERRLRRAFRMRDADGAHVEVEADSAEIAPARRVVTKAPWRELSSTAASLLPGFQAGPQLPVELVIRGFRSGDCVRVEGVVVEQRHDGTGSYRRAPSAPVPSRVRAQHVMEASPGIQARSTPAAEPPASAPLLPRFGAVLGLLFAGALAWAALSAAPIATFDAALRTSWVAFALVLCWRLLALELGQPHVGSGGVTMRLMPVFVTVRRAATRRTIYGIHYFSGTLALLFAIVALPWGLNTIAPGVLHDSGPEPGAFELAAIVPSSLLALALIIEEHVQTRATRRVARAILEAPAHTAQSSGWGYVEGHLDERAAWAHTIDLRTQRQHRVTALHVCELSRQANHVELSTPQGPLALVLREATWGSSAWRHVRNAGSSARISIETAPDARAIVVGHFATNATEVSAQGPESLLVFTTHARGNPRTELRVRLWLYRLGWIAPVLAATLLWVRAALGA